MPNEKVLVVDDEQNIIDLARLYLENDGFRVIQAQDGEEALAAIQKDRPDLIVLDLMLPKVDGWEVCRRTRGHSDVPIIMLTARSDDVDKIVGLELGADDYLTKPFNPRELLARVRAVLRRTAPSAAASRPLTVGDVTIDPGRREVMVKGQEVAMRAKEFDVLQTLAEHRGMVMTREQLLSRVWGYDFYGETRTVDVHIAHLRQRLAESDLEIETVWGVGYKLVG
jgi:two-component system alkaline phosphatase synthesis response regulator PhoP/two-component system response regulator ResD